MKDIIFKEPIKKQFEFDKSVATVFDDMINRSVPFYKVAQDLAIDFLSLRLEKNAKIVDLGCSTGEFLLSLFAKRADLELLGVDNSVAMLEIAQSKAKAYGSKARFINGDILHFNESGFDAAILNYTLQFIRPIKRENFLKNIYKSMKKGSILVLSEKLIYEDVVLNKQMIELYLNYKELQGYSRFEIAQKREALENVLIPYSESENRNLMLSVGFSTFETLFKWGNFATFIAIK